MHCHRNTQPAYAWEPEKGSHVGVMKRSGEAKDIVWFRGENCYVFHVMNAWEDGNRWGLKVGALYVSILGFQLLPDFGS